MFLDACPRFWCVLLSLQFSPAPSGLMYPSFQSIQARSQPTPARAEPAGSTNPISTAYSSFSRSYSPFIRTLLPLSFNSCNSRACQIHRTSAPGRHLGAERVGKDWEGCLHLGTRRWRQLIASSLSSHQPLLAETAEVSHHDTFSVRRLINSSCC